MIERRFFLLTFLLSDCYYYRSNAAALSASSFYLSSAIYFSLSFLSMIVFMSSLMITNIYKLIYIVYWFPIILGFFISCFSIYFMISSISLWIPSKFHIFLKTSYLIMSSSDLPIAPAYIIIRNCFSYYINIYKSLLLIKSSCILWVGIYCVSL